MTSLKIQFVSDISLVTADDWNALVSENYPFSKHEFLFALEASGAVGPGTGWVPHHLLVSEGGRIVAAMPSYLKQHSYGEYVFDHAWANAYAHNGLDYYPKLVTCIPFTPISGPRMLMAQNVDRSFMIALMIDAIKTECENLGCSSWHTLFPKFDADADKRLYSSKGLLQRKAVHFEWCNQGFESFDGFLATFSSRKRKNLRKERKAVADEGICFKVVEGGDICSDLWDEFYRFYQFTYAKRSGHGGYLPKEFFTRIGMSLAEHLVLVLAQKEGRNVAGAINFRSDNALYGRYWGAIEEVKHLHFETCYYQGIEYAIAHQLEYFDPGVQGEHKIQRGFVPRYTFSSHWIVHPEFRAAIDQFLCEENKYLEQYRADCEALLPFRSPVD